MFKLFHDNSTSCSGFREAKLDRGEEGLIIITRRVTSEAQTEVNCDGVTPIGIIDGNRLVELFEKYR